jgi:hypothetical protein
VKHETFVHAYYAQQRKDACRYTLAHELRSTRSRNCVVHLLVSWTHVSVRGAVRQWSRGRAAENERRRSWIACWLSIRTPKTPLRRSHRQDYARLVEAATSVAVDPRRRPAARASIDDASRGRAGSCVAEGGRELRHCATRPFSETMIVPLAS